ncbi:MAG: tripartite tricarboxylate transporter TctB family protein [Lachnospiraceae bacterium]
MTKKKTKLEELIICLALVVFGVALVVSAQSIQTGVTMGQGGDFMPKLCSKLWLLISALLLITTMIKPEERFLIKEAVQLRGFLATMTILLVYGLALKPVGFVISSIVYMLVQMIIFVPDDKRSTKMYLIFAVISVIMPILVNMLFVDVFSLVLPAGILK